MKTSGEKKEKLSLQDSNEVARFLCKLESDEEEKVVFLERGHVRARVLEIQPDKPVDLDATQPINGRDFHIKIRSCIGQGREGLFFRNKKGDVFHVDKSDSIIPPPPSE